MSDRPTKEPTGAATPDKAAQKPAKGSKNAPKGEAKASAPKDSKKAPKGEAKASAPKDSKKAPPPASDKAEPAKAPPPSPRPAPPPSGAERARVRRLAAEGWNRDRCALLGMRLETGPRANPWRRPQLAENGEETISALAVAVLASGASPSALELAAARLAARGEA